MPASAADPVPPPVTPPVTPPGERASDLARLLLRDPGRSVLMRVRGESMRDAGIRHGDLLLVERRRAEAGEVVVARLRGGLVLKRLVRRRGRWWLEAAHPAYPPLALGAGRLWGVAIHRIRALAPARGALAASEAMAPPEAPLRAGGTATPEASPEPGADSQAADSQAGGGTGAGGTGAGEREPLR